MHSQSNQTVLSAIGERGLLKRLLPGLPLNDTVCLGAGDDAALVRCGGWELALTSDATIEGRHFSAGDEPRRVGHKALAHALSDLAAMGAEPMWALINLAAPGETPLDRILDFYDGINRLARRFGVAVLGGDTSAAFQVELHVFAAGRLPPETARRRDAARPGDLLMVTGRLGGSRAGRHLDFFPRISEGRFLRDHVRAMIDISDGLATDARHIAAASRAGILLDAASIPVAPELDGMPRATALRHALEDGEDFELLVSVAPASAKTLTSAWTERFPEVPLTLIGVVTERSGCVELDDQGGIRQIADVGFDHFA